MIEKKMTNRNSIKFWFKGSRALAVVVLLIPAFWACGNAHAQKIGYTDAALILSLMPEAQQVQNELNVYEQNLKKSLEVKQAYLEQLIQEYQGGMQAGVLTPEQQKEKEAEVRKVQENLQTAAQQADRQFRAKQAQMMEPLADKVQKAIDDVAAQEGYDYIFNNNINGSSLILKAPKEHNVTLKVLNNMKVEIPDDVKKELEEITGVATPDTPGGGN